MLGPRGRIAGAAVVVIGLSTGCSPGGAESDPGVSGGQTTEPPGAASEPAAPESTAFHEQEVVFEPCDPPPPAPGIDLPDLGYECGSVEVPVDHARPDGERAQIALLRVPARGGDPIGSLMLNPGGPGYPGTELAPLAAVAWQESPVTDRFDLVGFDPRGVGSSVPAVDCYTDDQVEGGALMITFDDARDPWTSESAAEFRAGCEDGTGGSEMLDHLGTRDVARDLDIMRAALGDEDLTFVGISYGTRLGAVYAEMFPDNVRALALDAVMDPRASIEERRLQQAEGMQAAFDQLAAACAERDDCPLGDDPGGAVEEFQALTQPLVDRPVPALDGRELTFNTALGGVINGMYSEQTWPTVIEGLAELRDGRGDTLLTLSDAYLGRTAEGDYSDDLEAGAAINCLDEERMGPERMAQMTEASFDVAPFLDHGRQVRGSVDPCTDWPEPTLGFPYATDIDPDLPEPLVLSATGDPMTPHEGAIRLADELGGGLLSVEANQHGVVLEAASPCIQDALAAYLVDLELPEDGASCRL